MQQVRSKLIYGAFLLDDESEIFKTDKTLVEKYLQIWLLLVDDPLYSKLKRMIRYIVRIPEVSCKLDKQTHEFARKIFVQVRDNNKNKVQIYAKRNI